MKYLVTSERIATHQAIVEADSEDDAADAYLDGEWVEDKGELDEEDSLVMSVEEVRE